MRRRRVWESANDIDSDLRNPGISSLDKRLAGFEMPASGEHIVKDPYRRWLGEVFVDGNAL